MFATLLAPVGADAATLVSDTYVGSGVGHFKFVGRWKHVRNHADGRLFGSSSRTNDLAATVTLVFVGTVLRLYGVRGPGGGYATVAIDGERYPNIDFYSSEKVPRAVIFSSPLLAYGSHALRIGTIVDPRGSGSTAHYVNISGAVYR